VKRCPYCANMIKEDEFRCKHCNSWLPIEIKFDRDIVPETQSSIKFIAKHYYFIINCIILGLVLYSAGTYVLGFLAQKPTTAFFIMTSLLWIVLIIIYWFLLM
jgi:hypothetical protein